ncbi:MAG TPA: ribonuclease P protein component [Saprospiraceae bacterium]|nr:ribonuclease P protein component [Saprospiraceae bacterium]HQW55195.1 ribonuclease P protein component [Saprospiraceae bacterium]
MSAQKYTLGKSKKLKGKANIERLFASGRSLFKHPIKLIYGIEPPQSGKTTFQMGAAVSKKNIRSAVGRNTIKRHLREAVRLQQHELTAERNYKLMFIYVGPTEVQPTHIHTAIRYLLQQVAHLPQNETDK